MSCLLRSESDLQLLVGAWYAAELVDEVHVPGRAAELAVRGALKTEILLERHGVTDSAILLSS